MVTSKVDKLHKNFFLSARQLRLEKDFAEEATQTKNVQPKIKSIGGRKPLGPVRKVSTERKAYPR